MHFRKPTNLQRFSFPARLSKNRFAEGQLVYSQIILLRPWNELLDQQQKYLDHETCFKKSIKLSIKLKLSLENEIRFFLSFLK